VFASQGLVLLALSRWYKITAISTKARIAKSPPASAKLKINVLWDVVLLRPTNGGDATRGRATCGDIKGSVEETSNTRLEGIVAKCSDLYIGQCDPSLLPLILCFSGHCMGQDLGPACCHVVSPMSLASLYQQDDLMQQLQSHKQTLTTDLGGDDDPCLQDAIQTWLRNLKCSCIDPFATSSLPLILFQNKQIQH